MTPVLPRTYFGNIAFYTLYHQAEEITFEAKEHFLKQSYRNRCTISSANSIQDLIVQTNGNQRRQAIDTLEISYAEQWQRIHLGTLISSYKVSPYFEHYAHYFTEFYNDFQPKTLWELNQKAHEIIVKILDLETKEMITELFEKSYSNDYRDSFRPKDQFQMEFDHQQYIQVFEDRHGFVKNLSILDLIFNEGPNAISFL
jgi:hypothetical protein